MKQIHGNHKHDVVTLSDIGSSQVAHSCWPSRYGRRGLTGRRAAFAAVEVGSRRELDRVRGRIRSAISAAVLVMITSGGSAIAPLATVSGIR